MGQLKSFYSFSYSQSEARTAQPLFGVCLPIYYLLCSESSYITVFLGFLHCMYYLSITHIVNHWFLVKLSFRGSR